VASSRREFAEIYGRLICVLSRDVLLKKSVARSRILAQYSGFHFSQPFRFADFLEMLIGEPVGHRLQSNLNRGRKGPYSKPYFCIFDGFMNFNHSTFTTKPIPRDPEKFSQMLISLLRRAQELQLYHNESDWDMLIPLYYGDLNKPLQIECVSACFIQIKIARGVFLGH
jgi:hypothetical protein